MIYIHIPYCRSFCTYCDFYSEVASRCSSFDGFAKALSAEILARSGEIKENCDSCGVNTLYIGGGTPSVLPLSVFESILSSLCQAGCPSDFSEFTVEVNPEDIVEKGHAYIEGLLRLGVNRISMGVQSFDDSILKWMNRRHDSARAVQAYRILEECGVGNISIDLIFGLPQLSSDSWKEGLMKALDISPTGELPKHISSYQLSVEEGSALASLMAKGLWSEASEQVCSSQYECLCETLKEAGYRHYEISNFAQSGFEAQHNSAYWRHIPYVGLGPGAHSFFNDERKWNNPDLNAYVAASRSGDFSKVVGAEKLTLEQLALEKIMLALRTSEGVDEAFLMQSGRRNMVEEFLSKGMLLKRDGKVYIPENKFFISDSIISEIV